MLLLLSAISLLAPVYARTTEYTRDVDAAGSAGQLAPDRTPDLYTGDFADCLGGQSLFNVTKFSAAYYADERTVALHFDGTTNIKNESLMSKCSALSRRGLEANHDAQCTYRSMHVRQLLASLQV